MKSYRMLILVFGSFEISNKEGIRPRMFANENMINLLGLEHSLNPEDLYQYWFDRINKPYLSYIENAIVKLMNGKKSEVEYLWNHPKLGWIYVRCGGYLHSNDGTCSRIEGYHQVSADLTTIFDSKKFTLYDQLRLNNYSSYYMEYMMNSVK